MADYQVGDNFVVTVTQHLPLGLGVRLPDGSVGVVREREISWQRNTRRDWRQRFPVNQSFPALFLGNRNHTAEVSLRLAQDDPWQRIEKKYQPGQLVSGTVSSVVAYGVFVRLQPGIIGLLHQSQVPRNRFSPNLFWVGDSVQVRILEIDTQQRRISLSMLGIRQERWQELKPSERAGEYISSTNGRVNKIDRAVARSETEQPLRFLIVEDEEDQRSALKLWLRAQGHYVQVVESAEEAQALLQEQAFDIVLSDVHLGKGMDGIALTHWAVQQNIPSRFVLTTDWSRYSSREQELSELSELGVGLRIKPLLQEELLDIIDDRVEPAQRSEDSILEEDSLLEEVRELLHSSPQRFNNQRTNEQGELQRLLGELRRSTRASKVILFALDPFQRSVRVVRAYGGAELDKQILPELIHSPVRDAAEDRAPVRIGNLTLQRDFEIGG